MKSSISEDTEDQFISFMQEIFKANKGAPDEVLDPLLDEFERITEHPAGSDLIYYPEEGADNSAEGITHTIKSWRAANGLPGFRPHEAWRYWSFRPMRVAWVNTSVNKAPHTHQTPASLPLPCAV